MYGFVVEGLVGGGLSKVGLGGKVCNLGIDRRWVVRHGLRMSLAGSAVSVPMGVVKDPLGLFDAAVETGVKKATLPVSKIFVLGFLAGAYIAIGGLLMLSVGGSIPGVQAVNPGLHKILMGLVGLPTGLLLTLTTGAELFTGNTMLLAAAVLKGRATIRQLVKSWVVSFVANFVGALFIVALTVATGLMAGTPGGATAMALAKTKTGLTFAQSFSRSILCNWLVCLAVYLANGTSDMPGKVLAVLLPVSAFVAMGMEHSIANMFLIPLGISLGAPVTVGKFMLTNLMPVTLGNLLAGSIIVAGVFYFVFGRK
mmetsp:Transcript_18411/g.38542  ORF Transcript_18411/g.38542 Transcript_18411/m.38542 type:complete len:312 (-) Transcript_18411:1308-2243(-)